MNGPLVIGICGGTGSGKTTVAKVIAEALGGRCTYLSEDAYYRDHPELSLAERAKLNYDHPSAFDHNFLIAQLRALKAGQAVEKPTYNFQTHARRPDTEHVEASEVIILEGILVLDSPELRNLMDIRIFVDTDADVRVLRRTLRDVQERGRSLTSVFQQYLESVKPMHEAFVEPTKRYADIILPEGAFNQVGMDVIISKIKHELDQRSHAIQAG